MFFDNTRKPTGLGGQVMVALMNLGHRSLSDWGLHFLSLPANACSLDCGCGGGASLKQLLNKCPAGKVKGVDYAEISVNKSRRLNRKALQAGRCEVLQASVAALPFADGQFDLVTAFETVYFWPALAQSFGEIRRVLKPGGTFLICNECGGENKKDEKWTRVVDGMTIYTAAQLQSLLKQAGFDSIQIHRHSRGWLCVTARK